MGIEGEVELKPGDKVVVMKHEHLTGKVGCVTNVDDRRKIADSILGRLVYVDVEGVGLRTFYIDAGDQLRKEEWTGEERMAMNAKDVERWGF